MRILFWSELFRPHIGGVEVWSAQLIHALHERGHHCTAVASCGPPPALPNESMFEGIPVHRFAFHTALLDRDVAAIKRITVAVAALKREFRPDVIHLNTSQPSLFFHERTAAASPASVILTVHEPPLASANANSLLARVLNSSDWVVGVSNAMLQDALAVAPGVRSKCSVILNAIEETASEATAACMDDPLLCVGRLVEEKGFDLAIEALAKLARHHSTVRMIVAGDGPARARLQDHARALGVADRVQFLGWVEPHLVDALIAGASIVVMPSRWREPFGLLALQAAEAARPVVAFANGGLPEVVADGETGLLVPAAGGSDALADAVGRLLRQPEYAVALGMAARERKRRVFDYASFVSRYEMLYEHLVRMDTAAHDAGRP